MKMHCWSLLTIMACCLLPSSGLGAPRPNVILIMADDMGHGDLGLHGNPIIRTPHLDRFGRQGVRLQHFYVSPVCSPTRSSLMTGRYNYRTGIVDTALGRSMMHGDEVTLAEMLAGAGYQTGIFGKWHLGDCYPLRPIDQGFQEALVHRGGGIGQPSDPPGGSSYFDPVLFHNGQQKQTKGYCSDVFTDAAMDFMAKNRDRSFFIYLAFNAPHTPLQVPERYHQLYSKLNLAPAQFPAVGQPLVGKINHDDTARVYGMVTNIDDNLGRLLARLEELNLADNTIVIFLTDNGPQQVRYNSGMRGRKGTVHEGGTRVPFFVRWPKGFPGVRLVDPIAAHIDVVPTLLDVCGVPKPAGVSLDGVSLAPLLRGQKADWPERTLYFQWHRGEVPQLNRACAARSQHYRLVQPEGASEKKPAKMIFQLYDITKDPYEQHDLAAQQPDVVAKMRKGYEAWFQDVAATRNFAPPRIHLGSAKENPVVLTRQDWRGPKASWGPDGLGHWEVDVARPGNYDITVTLQPKAAVGGKVHLALGGVTRQKEIKAGATTLTFAAVPLPAGPGRLETWLATGERTVGVYSVEVRRRD